MNPYDYNGQQIDLDGYPSWQPYQCYDWANLWSNKLGYGRFVGDKASGIFGQQPDHYTWVRNSPDGVPPKGSVVVWDDGINGTVGHVAIATGEGDTNTFVSLDQNWGQPRIVPVRHNYNNVIGWGIPNNQGGGGVVIGSGENWYWRLNQLHTQLLGVEFPRKDFPWWVGKDTLTFIEAVSDNPYATQRGNVATVALRDKWDQQIYTLQAQLKNANEIVQQYKDGDVVDKQQLADLKKQVEKLTKKEPEVPTQGFEPSKPVVKRSIIDKILNLLTKGYYE